MGTGAIWPTTSTGLSRSGTNPTGGPRLAPWRRTRPPGTRQMSSVRRLPALAGPRLFHSAGPLIAMQASRGSRSAAERMTAAAPIENPIATMGSEVLARMTAVTAATSSASACPSVQKPPDVPCPRRSNRPHRADPVEGFGELEEGRDAAVGEQSVDEQESQSALARKV